MKLIRDFIMRRRRAKYKTPAARPPRGSVFVGSYLVEDRQKVEAALNKDGISYSITLDSQGSARFKVHTLPEELPQAKQACWNAIK